MNTEFNTIETIRTDATITNKSEAYLAACGIAGYLMWTNPVS